jgi:hypothetical protein
MPRRNIRKHSIAERWFFRLVACKHPAILLVQYFLGMRHKGFYGSMEEVGLLERHGVSFQGKET